MAQNRQKSYADHRRRDLEFQQGDKVYLKIIHSQVISQGKEKKKLSPRYIGLYEILERVGVVAYRLALPPTMSNIHNIFHISRLRKHEPDPTQKIPVEAIELREDLTYPEELVEILDTKEQVLRNKTIPIVKVLWRHHDIEEATWEREEEIRQNYPNLFDFMET
ncbi:uncharacterized protein LOC127804420 [Diospyros lotus]|uniref:uncharacterized protein LOC127804420 n=1 Tax=Diospyros lotus TaxID=55363 RepID=UPI002252A2D3|nr:uncharacterized protein LOC127804420 [Diospyros lotus]